MIQGALTSCHTSIIWVSGLSYYCHKLNYIWPIRKTTSTGLNNPVSIFTFPFSSDGSITWHWQSIVEHSLDSVAPRSKLVFTWQTLELDGRPDSSKLYPFEHAAQFCLSLLSLHKAIHITCIVPSTYIIPVGKVKTLGLLELPHSQFRITTHKHRVKWGAYCTCKHPPPFPLYSLRI